MVCWREGKSSIRIVWFLMEAYCQDDPDLGRQPGSPDFVTESWICSTFWQRNTHIFDNQQFSYFSLLLSWNRSYGNVPMDRGIIFGFRRTLWLDLFSAMWRPGPVGRNSLGHSPGHGMPSDYAKLQFFYANISFCKLYKYTLFYVDCYANENKSVFVSQF